MRRTYRPSPDERARARRVAETLNLHSRPAYLSRPLPPCPQMHGETPRTAEQGEACTRAHPENSVPDSRALTKPDEETAMTANDLTMTITGWAAADAQIRYTPSGTMLATVSVPFTPRRRVPETGQWEDAGETIWVDVTVWGDAAERFAAAVTKGTPITATGRPRLRSWAAGNGAPRAGLNLDARTWGTQPPGPGRQAQNTPAPGSGWSSTPQQPQAM